MACEDVGLRIGDFVIADMDVGFQMLKIVGRKKILKYALYLLHFNL